MYLISLIATLKNYLHSKREGQKVRGMEKLSYNRFASNAFIKYHNGLVTLTTN